MLQGSIEHSVMVIGILLLFSVSCHENIGSDHQLKKLLIVKKNSPRQYHSKCRENSMGNIYSDARVWRVKALMRTLGWTPQKRKSIVLTVRFDNENNDSKENNKFWEHYAFHWWINDWKWKEEVEELYCDYRRETIPFSLS